MEYTVIRSGRRTMAIEVRPEGVLVRAPFSSTDKAISAFVEQHSGWIEKQVKKTAEARRRNEALPALTAGELAALAEQARLDIPPRVRHYAPLVGVKYGSITIRRQRTKWGSCSAKGNLNFNCLLMLAPPEVRDSVIVHELCHLKEMNHSERFYREVLRVFPEYRRWDGWLKKNGGAILSRMIRGMDQSP